MRALAARAGMSQPFLSNLENSRAMPSIATLYKIAAALGVSPRDFLPAEGARSFSVTRAGEGTVAPVGDEDGSALSRVVAGGPGPHDRGPRVRRERRRRARRLVRARG